MNTRQLHHFLAILDHQTLSAAAESVHLSQPALSRSIQSLEEQLGVQLFARKDRRLRPTPYALAYEPLARRIVFDEKEGKSILKLMQSGESGQVALGMGPSLTDEILHPLLDTLLDTAPEVKIKACVDTSGPLLGLLRNRQIDFFVGDVSIARQQPDLHIEELYTCGLGWFVKANHPLADARTLDISMIDAWPKVTGAGYFDPQVVDQIKALYGLPANFHDHFSVQSNDVQLVKRLLFSRSAVLIATDLTMLGAVRAGLVKRIDIQPAISATLTLGIIYLKDRLFSPVSERVLMLIREQFQQLPQRGLLTLTP